MALPRFLRLFVRSQRPLAVACVVALVAAPGCRHIDNAQTDVLERELRQQEDYIYELEDYLLDYSEKLREARMMCQGEVVSSGPAPRREIEAGAPELGDDRSPPTISRPKTAASRKPAAPRVAPPPSTQAKPRIVAGPAESEEPTPGPAVDEPGAKPSAPAVDPEELEAPELEIGPPSSQAPLEWGPSLADVQSQSPTPTAIPDPAEYEQADSIADNAPLTPIPDPAELQLAGPQNASAIEAPAPVAGEARLTPATLEIRHIFAQPSPDDPTKLEGLLVVVEAQSAAGEPVDAEGDASLMVMTGPADSPQRIERWNFTPEETRTAWQSSNLGDGLHLDLPLADGQLPPGQLELWARLVSADGEKLLAKLPFEAVQLTTLDAAEKGSSLATTQAALEPTLAEPLVPVSATEKVEGPTWRKAHSPVGPRTEGYATSASRPQGAWTARSSTRR